MASASEVRALTKALMAAYPKGTRFGPTQVIFRDGEPQITVTPLADSVQADPDREARHEAIEQIRRRTRASTGA
jgi:hypothetical protein